MLSEMFRNVIANYGDKTGAKFKSDDFTEIITKQIPQEIKNSVNQPEKYLFKGSVGQGNWAETPWIAILNATVTSSTRTGYYVCYLIDPKQRSMYLSLATGWTQFEEEYPLRIARERILDYSNYLHGQLSNKYSLFNKGFIDLSATRSLSKGYELGQILNKRYDLNDIQQELLITDLNKILSAYEELISVAGNDIQNISYEKVHNNENLDQDDKDINKVTLKLNSSNAIDSLRLLVSTKPPEKKNVFLRKAVRNPKIARLIKEGKGYVCEICGKEPFTQKNGKPYAEADHIIPLGGDTNGLDSPDNMRCLCAQCHAVITHGSDYEIRKMLTN